MVSIRSPNPAASKTRKKTSAAIRATMDSPLVIVLKADWATPAKLPRSTEDAALRSASLLIPNDGQQSPAPAGRAG